MGSLSGFTFVATCFIVGLVGIVYIFVTPMFNIFMGYANSLSPTMSSIYWIFELFWRYVPLVAFIALVIFILVNSMSYD